MRAFKKPRPADPAGSDGANILPATGGAARGQHSAGMDWWHGTGAGAGERQAYARGRNLAQHWAPSLPTRDGADPAPPSGPNMDIPRPGSEDEAEPEEAAEYQGSADSVESSSGSLGYKGSDWTSAWCSEAHIKETARIAHGYRFHLSCRPPNFFPSTSVTRGGDRKYYNVLYQVARMRDDLKRYSNKQDFVSLVFGSAYHDTETIITLFECGVMTLKVISIRAWNRTVSMVLLRQAQHGRDLPPDACECECPHFSLAASYTGVVDPRAWPLVKSGMRAMFQADCPSTAICELKLEGKGPKAYPPVGYSMFLNANLCGTRKVGTFCRPLAQPSPLSTLAQTLLALGETCFGDSFDFYRGLPRGVSEDRAKLQLPASIKVIMSGEFPHFDCSAEDGDVAAPAMQQHSLQHSDLSGLAAPVDGSASEGSFGEEQRERA